MLAGQLILQWFKRIGILVNLLLKKSKRGLKEQDMDSTFSKHFLRN